MYPESHWGNPEPPRPRFLVPPDPLLTPPRPAAGHRTYLMAEEGAGALGPHCANGQGRCRQNPVRKNRLAHF